jgi:hypothetical protein
MSQAPTKPPEPEDREEVLGEFGGENVDEVLERGERKHERKAEELEDKNKSSSRALRTPRPSRTGSPRRRPTMSTRSRSAVVSSSSPSLV